MDDQPAAPAADAHAADAAPAPIEPVSIATMITAVKEQLAIVHNVAKKREREGRTREAANAERQVRAFNCMLNLLESLQYFMGAERLTSEVHGILRIVMEYAAPSPVLVQALKQLREEADSPEAAALSTEIVPT